MTDAQQVIARQLTRSGEIFILAMEPLDEEEFFAENGNGFSAAWVTGHLACVADLFSSWFDGGRLLLGEGFHAVFNETAVVPASGISKAASVDRQTWTKDTLLLLFRQAVVKALRVLGSFESATWDAPAPPGVPVTMRTGGDVWEILAAHVYWHLGELAGSMARFRGTYALNIAPHHLYAPPPPGLPEAVRGSGQDRNGYREAVSR
jgi:DinB family protein